MGLLHVYTAPLARRASRAATVALSVSIGIHTCMYVYIKSSFVFYIKLAFRAWRGVSRTATDYMIQLCDSGTQRKTKTHQNLQHVLATCKDVARAIVYIHIYIYI